MISIIVPIYNEEKVISRNSVQLKRLSECAELLFVDGGSTDRSIETTSGIGSLLHSAKGRSLQMNRGGFSAKGDILFFMHADTMIPQDALSFIEKAIGGNGYVGGCLTQRIDNGAVIYRFIEGEGNLRARLTKVFYGDQGIFVKRDIFMKLGGFPEVPILEDVLFTRKLRKEGKTVVLPCLITVSPRRWEKRGIVRTALLYNLITILFRLRVPLGLIKNMVDDLR